MMADAFEALAACGKVAVVAGHYCVAPELEDLSHEGDAEMLSFEKGLEAHNALRARGRQSVLCLWVNDIGISAQQRALMKDGYEIPENYVRLASRADVSPSDILVLFESAARNKASTLLRKLGKNAPGLFRRHSSNESGLVRCVEGASCEIAQDQRAYVIDGPGGENLVVKEGPNPKCNLILATLFLGLRQQHGCDGILNIFNSIYVNRIRLGAYVFDKLFAASHPVAFEHYFCDEARIRREAFGFGREPQARMQMQMA